MSNLMNRRTAITVWLATLVALTGAGALWGVSLTMNTGALLFVAGVVPPAVILMVWRGAPPPTVAEVLHAVDRQS